DTVLVDDRRNGVEKGQRVLASLGENGIGKGRGGQRAAGDDDIAPVFRRPAGDLFADHRYIRVVVDCAGDLRGKAVPVDGERTTCRQLVLVSGPHDERAAA